MRFVKMEVLIVFIAMIIVVALSSCMLFPVRRYDIGIRNMTYHKFIYDAGKIGSYSFNHGIIGPPDKKIFKWSYGTSFAHLGSIPKTVTIKWKKYNGEMIDIANPVQGSGVIVKKVIVKANLPKGFQNGDEIIFNFTEKNKIVLSFRMRKYKYEVNSKGERVFYIYTNDTLDPKNLSDFFKTDGWEKYFEAKRKNNAEKQLEKNKQDKE